MLSIWKDSSQFQYCQFNKQCYCKNLSSKRLPDLNLVMVHSIHPELMLEKHPELCRGVVGSKSQLSCHLGCLVFFFFLRLGLFMEFFYLLLTSVCMKCVSRTCSSDTVP